MTQYLNVVDKKLLSIVTSDQAWGKMLSTFTDQPLRADARSRDCHSSIDLHS